MPYCHRCAGRKEVYKMGSGFSLMDTGGPKIECPACKGSGYHTSLDDEIASLKKDLADSDESMFNKDGLKKKKGRPRKVSIASDGSVIGITAYEKSLETENL